MATHDADVRKGPEHVISIIVPVYKVEPFLSKCVDSIINQSYTALEIILIDDGSPDSCGEICDQYAKQDKRVKVFHTENQGLSAARNIGLREATGDYIGFVDSDDWIEPDMYELLINTVLERKVDICECGLWNEQGNRSRLYGQSTHVNVIRYKKEESLLALVEERITNPVWNKIYNRSVFTDIQFPEGKNYEDVACMHRIIGQANAFVSINNPMYHYRQRPESISQTHNTQNLLDYVDACLDRQYYLKAVFPDVFTKKQVEIMLLTAKSISRLWRWWHSVEHTDKKGYKRRIQELKKFSKNSFPVFGFQGWPLYIRISTLFMHSDSWLSFVVLYYLNQIYRKLKPERA
nr:glycosyltransferase [Clostridia bacterium]